MNNVILNTPPPPTKFPFKMEKAQEKRRPNKQEKKTIFILFITPTSLSLFGAIKLTLVVMYTSLMKGLEMDQALIPQSQDKPRAFLDTSASEKRSEECLSFCKKKRKEKKKKKGERRREKGGIISVVRARRCLLFTH